MKYRNAQFKLPPKIFTHDGITYNGILPNAEALLEHGYFPCIEIIKPIGDYKATWTIENEQWIKSWIAYIPEPIIIQYSKRKLRKALTDRGYGDDLRTLFDSSQRFREAWLDNSVLLSDDTELMQALVALKNATGMSNVEGREILAEAEII